MLGRLLHFLARVTPSQFVLFIATVMLSCYTFSAIKVRACTSSGVTDAFDFRADRLCIPHVKSVQDDGSAF